MKYVYEVKNEVKNERPNRDKDALNEDDLLLKLKFSRQLLMWK